MTRYVVFVFLSLFYLSPTYAIELPYGDRLEALPPNLTKVLARIHLPDDSGAMGRNRPQYFHVRFQLGLHHLIQHAIAAKNIKALEHFVSALEYAFSHQKENGDFQIAIPPQYASLDKPGFADSISGVAFFISSACSGIYAVETSTWIQQTARLKPLVERIRIVKSKLPITLDFLSRNWRVLETVDKTAPNRLLFDAVAFYSLAKLLDSATAYKLTTHFMEAATHQIHAEGYFIEAGGYDSSYNGVATALALRLVLMGVGNLEPVARNAIAWQISRITPDGEILTDGNTRVHPEGEHFLGRRKDIDVGHTLEALILSAINTKNKEHVQIAKRVLGYYRQR